MKFSCNLETFLKWHHWRRSVAFLLILQIFTNCFGILIFDFDHENAGKVNLRNRKSVIKGQQRQRFMLEKLVFVQI